MKTGAFLIGAFATLIWLQAQDAAPRTRSAAWFDQVLVGMEVGPTGAQWGHSDRTDPRYCARFDGREIVRNALAAHSEYPGLVGARWGLCLLQLEAAAQGARSGRA
ncbi:MAG: hypothetical protein AB9869_34270 [Verrucomicrobiia bacterium]